MVIKPSFKSISDFVDGYAQISENNKSNYIDKLGEKILIK